MREINQRMVSKMFKHQIERNVNNYVDDIIVKNKMVNLLMSYLGKKF